MNKTTLIISKEDPSGHARWLCWIEGDEDKGSSLISTVPCGVEWAFNQGKPVTHWKFHGEATAMSAEALRYSAQRVVKDESTNKN